MFKKVLEAAPLLILLTAAAGPAHASARVCTFKPGIIIIHDTGGNVLAIEVEGKLRPYIRVEQSMIPRNAGLPAFRLVASDQRLQWLDEEGLIVDEVSCLAGGSR